MLENFGNIFILFIPLSLEFRNSKKKENQGFVCFVVFLKFLYSFVSRIMKWKNRALLKEITIIINYNVHKSYVILIVLMSILTISGITHIYLQWTYMFKSTESHFNSVQENVELRIWHFRLSSQALTCPGKVFSWRLTINLKPISN